MARDRKRRTKLGRGCVLFQQRFLRGCPFEWNGTHMDRHALVDAATSDRRDAPRGRISDLVCLKDHVHARLRTQRLPLREL